MITKHLEPDNVVSTPSLAYTVRNIHIATRLTSKLVENQIELHFCREIWDNT